MEGRIESYISEVLNCMVAEEKIKDRIANDLRAHIETACESESLESVLEKMGTPEEVAREFMDTLYEDKSEVIDRLIKQKILTDKLMKDYYEYKSKATLFGLPLIHIKLHTRHSRGISKPLLAKGIIAIGDISVGAISIGGIAIGGFCFGGLSLGLVSTGGMALGVIAAGGFAAGLFAIGGFAAGLGAVGGITFGKIAVGGLANGHVAIGSEAAGQYVLNTKTGSFTQEEVYQLIKAVYPKLADWMVKIFAFFAAGLHQ